MARWNSTGSTVKWIVPTKSFTLTPVAFTFLRTRMMDGFGEAFRDFPGLDLRFSAMIAEAVDLLDREAQRYTCTKVHLFRMFLVGQRARTGVWQRCSTKASPAHPVNNLRLASIGEGSAK